jgi:hypothetical protein
MHHGAKLLTSVSVVSLAGVVVLGIPAAHAEVADDVDQAIVTTALTNLIANPVSEDLLAELTSAMDIATDAGIIDQEIIDAISKDVTADETDTSQANPDAVDALPADEVEKLLDAHLDNDQQLWDEISPAWLQAFETIRTEFEACRADGTATSKCARTMAFSLQIAHAEAAIAALDERAAAVANLPDDERAAALAAIESERAALEATLIRSQERLALLSATNPADPITAHAAEHGVALGVVLSRARELARGVNGTEQASSSPQTRNTPDAQQPPTTSPTTPLAPSSGAPRQESSTRETPANQSNRGKSDDAGAGKNAGAGKSDSR